MKPTIIEILSDDEEKEVFKSRELQILQRQIQDEANLSGSKTGLLLAVTKQFIEGTPKQKDKKLTQRIKKMFLDKSSFDISKDYFCLKRQPNYNAMNCQLTLNELLIFGTDFWPSRNIKSDAKNIVGQVEVIKVDDSHTKITFPSYALLVKWLSFYILDKNTKAKMEEDGQQMMPDFVEADNHSKLKGWFELQPYFYQGFERKRQARFCTDSQKNLKEMIENTKLTNYMKFKEQIQEQILKQQAAKISLQMAEERSRNMRKFRNWDRLNQIRDKSRSYVSHQQRRDRKEGSRSRQKGKNKDRQNFQNRHQVNKQHSNKKRYENRREHHDRSRVQTQIGKNPRIQTRQGKTYQSNFLDIHINDQDDNASSYSFLLEANQNLNSITNAMKQMDLEDQQHNLSVEIAPRKQHAENIQMQEDMSLIIREKDIQKNTQKNIGMKKKGHQKTIQQDKRVNENKESMKAAVVSKIVNKSQKPKSDKFDYLKYIEQSELEEEAQRKIQEYKQKSND